MEEGRKADQAQVFEILIRFLNETLECLGTERNDGGEVGRHGSVVLLGVGQAEGDGVDGLVEEGLGLGVGDDVGEGVEELAGEAGLLGHEGSE